MTTRVAASPHTTPPPAQGNENEPSSSRITTIVLPILALLAGFVFFPFEAALPIAAAITIGALFLNGCLNPEKLRSSFMTGRVGPRPHVVEEHKGDGDRPYIPVAVPVQPFTGHHAHASVRPPVARPMTAMRMGPDPRMAGVTHFRPTRPSRPPATGRREEVGD